MDKVTVEIPAHYLLEMATYGNLGQGKLGDLMQMWAQKRCEEHGLGAELKKMQLEKLEELRRGLQRVLGPEIMQALNSGLETAAAALKIAQAAEATGSGGRSPGRGRRH